MDKGRKYYNVLLVGVLLFLFQQKLKLNKKYYFILSNVKQITCNAIN
jgi:hypothetical protein